MARGDEHCDGHPDLCLGAAGEHGHRPQLPTGHGAVGQALDQRAVVLLVELQCPTPEADILCRVEPHRSIHELELVDVTQVVRTAQQRQPSPVDVAAKHRLVREVAERLTQRDVRGGADDPLEIRVNPQLRDRFVEGRAADVDALGAAQLAGDVREHHRRERSAEVLVGGVRRVEPRQPVQHGLLTWSERK